MTRSIAVIFTLNELRELILGLDQADGGGEHRQWLGDAPRAKTFLRAVRKIEDAAEELGGKLLPIRMTPRNVPHRLYAKRKGENQ